MPRAYLIVCSQTPLMAQSCYELRQGTTSSKSKTAPCFICYDNWHSIDATQASTGARQRDIIMHSTCSDTLMHCRMLHNGCSPATPVKTTANPAIAPPNLLYSGSTKSSAAIKHTRRLSQSPAQSQPASARPHPTHCHCLRLQTRQMQSA